MSNKVSLRVALSINDMYARLARKAAERAAKWVEVGELDRAENAAALAEEWAKRAGGNALRYGL